MLARSDEGLDGIFNKFFHPMSEKRREKLMKFKTEFYIWRFFARL
jgi:hypothetical protein